MGRHLKARWTPELEQDAQNFSPKTVEEPVGDVHMRNPAKEPLLDPDHFDVLYYTLCGTIVKPANIDTQPAKSWADQAPTCLGCILVNLQNKAEEQHGSKLQHQRTSEQRALPGEGTEEAQGRDEGTPTIAAITN